MYGLAVNLIMSVSGHPSIINEICSERLLKKWTLEDHSHFSTKIPLL